MRCNPYGPALRGSDMFHSKEDWVVKVAPSTPVCLSIHPASQTRWTKTCMLFCTCRLSGLKIIILFFSLFFFFFSLGTCIDLVNNYTCNCHVGFTGPRCKTKIADCNIDSCYPNVTCLKVSDTISCGPCPLGFSGDGRNCEGDYKKNGKIGF